MSKTKILIGITICLMFLTMVGAAERPTVIITFDDGWLSVYTKAYPIMQANNQKGVDFVIIDPILGGWSDFTQRSQLNTLYAAGWDISSHTYSHIALTTANNTTLNYELAASKGWLNANGYPRGAMLLAYPYGDYNSNVIAALKANGYAAARTIEASNTNNMHYNLSSPDIFSLKSYEVIGGQDNDITIINQIDNTIASNGLLILAFHKIVDTLSANATNAETEFTTSDFQNVSNYLKSRNVDVRTLSDYLGVVPIITNSPVAGIPVTNTQTITDTSVVTGIPAAPKNTRSDYTIERVYYIPAETQPIEVATPKPAETPDLNTQITSGGWVAVHNQENITKEPEKSIFEKIVEFLRRFYA